MSQVVSSITQVFSAIADWIAEAIPTFTEIFYTTEGGLTFLGTLAVIALGISVFFLLMGLVQNFLHFRG